MASDGFKAPANAKYHLYRMETTSEWYIGCRLQVHVSAKVSFMLLFNRPVRNGVCIWTLGDNPKESVSMNYVCYPGYGDITSIAWDPTPASHLLVAASRTAGTLVVFDLLFMRSTPLKSHGEGSRLLRWSPDGQWLYVASMYVTFRRTGQSLCTHILFKAEACQAYGTLDLGNTRR